MSAEEMGSYRAITAYSQEAAGPHAGKVVLREPGKPDEVIGDTADFPLTMAWPQDPQ